MAKVDATLIAAIKEYFEAGDKLSETGFNTLIDAIAQAAEDHAHTPTGGSGSGTGDASPVTGLQHGTAAQRPGSPSPGDIYVETDTEHLLVCFTAGAWVQAN